MKNLISLARAQAATQVNAARISGTPAELSVATAQQEQLEKEIAMMEKAIGLLRGYVNDIAAVKMSPEQATELSDEYMDPQYCLDVPVFEQPCRASPDYSGAAV